ncbi:MAG TPA: methylated-DNA--[protein]-cysteine S-methyltransferase [Anaerolineae bacterium]|nr:methylated-DNA--[protein]-cysteine S-methyltransferase [Anaerolineae bacterium]HOQ98154.1 methylated-DNA--[protein]-cysteine S-methyltransferase [Anaerolineae bacterium]
MSIHYFTCDTAFGWLAVAASGEGLVAVSWPAETPAAAVVRLGLDAAVRKTEPGATWGDLARRLVAYFAGERVSFDREPIDCRGVPAFRCRAWAAVQAIPWGTVRSYGQVARELGAPRAARAIGGAMAANPVPIIVPCHRVLGANGALTGFGPGLPMKARLLALEGIDPGGGRLAY